MYYLETKMLFFINVIMVCKLKCLFNFFWWCVMSIISRLLSDMLFQSSRVCKTIPSGKRACRFWQFPLEGIPSELLLTPPYQKREGLWPNMIHQNKGEFQALSLQNLFLWAESVFTFIQPQNSLFMLWVEFNLTKKICLDKFSISLVS